MHSFDVKMKSPSVFCSPTPFAKLMSFMNDLTDHFSITAWPIRHFLFWQTEKVPFNQRYAAFLRRIWFSHDLAVFGRSHFSLVFFRRNWAIQNGVHAQGFSLCCRYNYIYHHREMTQHVLLFTKVTRGGERIRIFQWLAK